MVAEQPVILEFNTFQQVAQNGLDDFQAERRRVFHDRPHPTRNVLFRRWTTLNGYNAEMLLEPWKGPGRLRPDCLTPFGYPDVLTHIQKSREDDRVEYQGVRIEGEYWWVRFELSNIPRGDMLNSPGSYPRDSFMARLRFQNDGVEVYGSHPAYYGMDYNLAQGESSLQKLHYNHWRVLGDGMMAQYVILPRDPVVLQPLLPEMFIHLSLRNPLTEPRFEDGIVYGNEVPFNPQLAVK